MLSISSIGAATAAALVMFAPTPVRATSSSVVIQISYALEDLDTSDGVTPKLREYRSGGVCQYSDANWGSWGHSFYCGLYSNSWKFYPQQVVFSDTAAGDLSSPRYVSLEGSTVDPAGGYEGFLILPQWSDRGPSQPNQYMELSSMTRLTMTLDVAIQAQGQNVCADSVCIQGNASASFSFLMSDWGYVNSIEPFSLGTGTHHRELVFDNTSPYEAPLPIRIELAISGLNQATAAPPIPEVETYWMMALGLLAVGASRRYRSWRA